MDIFFHILLIMVSFTIAFLGVVILFSVDVWLEVIHTYTIDPKKTLLEVEKFALDEVDEKIKEEINS